MSYSKFGPGWKSEPVPASEPPPSHQRSRHQAPTDSSSTEKNDHSNDRAYIVAFAVFLVIWMCVGGFAFYSGDSMTVDFINGMQHGDVMEVTQFLLKYFDESKNIVFGFLALALGLLLALVCLIRWAAKPLIYATIALTSAGLLLLYPLIFYGVHRWPGRLYRFAVLTGLVLVYAVVIYTFRQTGMKAVSKIVRQSCKAMFFFPSTFVLAILQLAIELLIVGYFGAVYMYLNSIRRMRDDLVPAPETVTNATATMTTTTTTTAAPGALEEFIEEYDIFEEYQRLTQVPYYVLPLHGLNFLGLLWALGFVAGVARMTLTATFAAWYRCADKERLPLWTMPRNFCRMLGRHSGTIAYAASPAALVPMIIVVHEHGRDRLKEMLRKPFLVLSWLLILWRFPSDALAECAMHGRSFYKSARDSYVLLMKNPMSLLTTNTISECMIFIATILVPFLASLATLLYCQLHRTVPEPVKAASLIIVTLASLIMSVTFFAVFRAASSTIHRCHLEDSKFNHEAEMNLYEIQVDDESTSNNGAEEGA